MWPTLLALGQRTPLPTSVSPGPRFPVRRRGLAQSGAVAWAEDRPGHRTRPSLPTVIGREVAINRLEPRGARGPALPPLVVEKQDECGSIGSRGEGGWRGGSTTYRR
ncbi:hypothetical protein NDU88_011780 [Pleurodeles waltl]|uniref:Uncharacterized protein n=1 Tax=Pleurodeles waltl TaxID=8319 RepID=A0AAV7S7A3_PLEWA|nr:hypothetical protein NDU88_011780 [Pleurodeles waltl]